MKWLGPRGSDSLLPCRDSSWALVFRGRVGQNSGNTTLESDSWRLSCYTAVDVFERPPPSPPSHDGLEGEPAFRFSSQVATGPPAGGLFHFRQTSTMSEPLNFDKQNGLIAAVVQDADSKRVLMIGYMNR